MTAGGVDSDRRYTNGRRCPICGGRDGDPRGVERRCFGFVSRDGEFAHCSREEHAGSIKKSENSDTYGHRLVGPCACGSMHSDADPARARTPKRTIAATYDYHDEEGKLLYQVVRFDPKEFRQRRRDPEHLDRWIWKLGDMRRVLYRLDRVLEADPDATIYVVEGEKDVHALESLGLVATCNPQGAGKWSAVTDCAKVALRGRRVTIIADKDDKGRKHAADIASSLRDIADAVRIVESPIGKDAADWMAGGATAEEVERTCANVSPAQLDEEFDVDRDGKKYHSQRNIKLALRKFGVGIRFNVFSRRRVVDGLPGFGPRLDDDALNHLRLKIDSEFNLRLGKEFFYDVIVDHGHAHRFHPVRDYLAGLRWDGAPRLDGWLTRYAAAADTRYTRAIGSLVLIAAVRRVRQPGCKFDEMLILESEQGKNKSTALAILAVEPDWFTDDLPLGEDTRKMIEQTSGRWIVEAGELRGMSRGDVHTLKQYLGRTEDKARLAYGHETGEFARQFVIIGTTNEVGGYLRDATGNRRFWPVRVQTFDLERLRTDRDQLWAEQEERRLEDPMEVLVRKAFGDITGRIAITEAWQVLGIQGRVLTQDEMQRFGNAMRMLGWQRKRGRTSGELAYVYYRGSEGESERWVTVRGRNVEPR